LCGLFGIDCFCQVFKGNLTPLQCFAAECLLLALVKTELLNKYPALNFGHDNGHLEMFYCEENTRDIREFASAKYKHFAEDVLGLTAVPVVGVGTAVRPTTSSSNALYFAEAFTPPPPSSLPPFLPPPPPS
jgi:hypothetical protein